MQTRKTLAKLLAVAVLIGVVFLRFPGFSEAQVVGDPQVSPMASPHGDPPFPTPTPSPSCVHAGCSGELCVDSTLDSIVGICIFRPEYACYQQATCERQSNGQCGFTQTSQLQTCLDQVHSSPAPSPSVSPAPTCYPRPACLDANPPCYLSERSDYCPPPYAPEDINKDGKVNLLDYAILVNELFKTGDSLQADLNHDGKVNLLDYSILIQALRT